MQDINTHTRTCTHTHTDTHAHTHAHTHTHAHAHPSLHTRPVMMRESLQTGVTLRCSVSHYNPQCVCVCVWVYVCVCVCLCACSCTCVFLMCDQTQQPYSCVKHSFSTNSDNTVIIIVLKGQCERPRYAQPIYPTHSWCKGVIIKPADQAVIVIPPSRFELDSTPTVTSVES